MHPILLGFIALGVLFALILKYDEYECGGHADKTAFAVISILIWALFIIGIWFGLYLIQPAQFKPDQVYIRTVHKVDNVDIIIIDDLINLNELHKRSFEDGQQIEYTTYKHAKLYLWLSGNTTKKPTIELIK